VVDFHKFVFEGERPAAEARVRRVDLLAASRSLNEWLEVLAARELAKRKPVTRIA
jgi:hypothetical protein